jgi:UDP-2,3-diacylglucosamine pyrophosphatase LpxH
MLTRREFLAKTLAAGTGLALAPAIRAANASESFSFVLLGDLHFDRLEHHDMSWVEANKANDITQIKNYCRITAEITPKLFAVVKQAVADSKSAFVMQVGDLVEGLCGSAELAARQNREAVEFIRDANLGVPFYFTKGNHDITGDGAAEAFTSVFHPFLSKQLRGALTSANYTFEHGSALFCSFDAYDRSSLDWLEAALAKRTAKHCFVVVHPPVVPYGARATWHVYSNVKDKPKREKLLDLLGQQRAIVLGGHIHKFNSLVRVTPKAGRFSQLAISSIISAPNVQPKDLLSGAEQYNPDQIRVEPKFSPETAEQRRAVYDSEKEFVKRFEYADLPGYALINVRPDVVEAKIYTGVTQNLWRTVNLSASL